MEVVALARTDFTALAVLGDSHPPLQPSLRPITMWWTTLEGLYSLSWTTLLQSWSCRGGYLMSGTLGGYTKADFGFLIMESSMGSGYMLPQSEYPFFTLPYSSYLVRDCDTLTAQASQTKQRTKTCYSPSCLLAIYRKPHHYPIALIFCPFNARVSMQRLERSIPSSITTAMR
jgi:hypothetical protein